MNYAPKERSEFPLHDQVKNRNGRRISIVFTKIHTIYTNNRKLKGLFVSLNAFILGTAKSNCKILFVFRSPFVEEGFELYNIALQLIGAKYQRKMLRKRENY